MPNVSRRLYPNLPDELQQWAPPNQYIATVTKVSDGDSIHVAIQLGFGVIMPEIRVRLLGIDAPELIGAEKMQATHSKRQLTQMIQDKWVGLQTHADQSCRYGRWLGVIWLPRDGHLININQWMVQENLAKPLKVNRSFDAKPEHLIPLLKRCQQCNSFT